MEYRDVRLRLRDLRRTLPIDHVQVRAARRWSSWSAVEGDAAIL